MKSQVLPIAMSTGVSHIHQCDLSLTFVENDTAGSDVVAMTDIVIHPAPVAYGSLHISASFRAPVFDPKIAERVSRYLSMSKFTWLSPLNTPGKWCIDLDTLRDFFKDDTFSATPWMSGRVSVESQIGCEAVPTDTATDFRMTLRWFYTPNMKAPQMQTPHELQPSLDKFHLSNPDPQTCGFLMMRFGTKPIELEIHKTIVDVCKGFGLTILRADDKEYSPDLFPNVRTYMHGCSFGIAVFERLLHDDFNPNVSLEVGYMMALGKPICLLKDGTLSTLQTDLVGRMYRPFDVQAVKQTIKAQLEGWLKDHNIGSGW